MIMGYSWKREDVRDHLLQKFSKIYCSSLPSLDVDFS